MMISPRPSPTLFIFIFFSFSCKSYVHSFFDEDYNPIIVKNATFGQAYHGNVSSDKENIFVFPSQNYSFPARITVESHDSSLREPLLVVVTQLKSILSWQIPLVGLDDKTQIFTFDVVSRTLCPDIEDTVGVVISLSTRSSAEIHFILWANRTDEFEVVPSKWYNVQVSPAQPQFFKFTFDEDISSALLHVESDDEPCMTLSVQPTTCPVYDLEGTVQFKGRWQTVISKGGIFLKKDDYDEGLYIVLVVHSNNKACTGKTSFTKDQRKSVRFQLERSINDWDYVVAVAVVLGGFFFIYLLAVCLSLCSSRRKCQDQSVEAPVDSGTFSPYGIGPSCLTTPTTPLSPAVNSDDSDLSDTEIDMLYEADSSKEVIRTKQILFLSDLAQKDPRVLSLKSKLYLWNMVTVAVFYALPVVQLVFSYQQVSNNSGNLDLCYYNFLCSHRLQYFSDFNHIYSNIGYLLFGLLFLGLTWRRQKLCHSVGRHLGIPYHYGMFYALGVALCMEGVLSACYHLCPNHSNFQFDTAFMYVLSMISMIKIYQTRHPDITASAYTTFGALALVIVMGMVGVLNGSNWYYVAFTIVHLLTCFVITAQIYHVGTWKFDLGMFRRFSQRCRNDYNAGGLKYLLRPMYPARMVLLFLANVGNWALVGLWPHLHVQDFATYMLSIFMANLLMYFIFYIAMKLVSKEKILNAPLIYIILAFAFWSAGLYFFYHKSISWKLTPAESRAYNQPCEILNFYDKHDIWHFLSAGGMFFSFMVLLTLDDDIAEKDRRVIPVF